MSKAERIVLLRNHAEELRTLSDHFRRESEKEALWRIAATYDRLADEVTGEPDFRAMAQVRAA